MSVSIAVFVALRINNTTSTNVFFYMGTIGVLSLLVVYSSRTRRGKVPHARPA